MRGIFTSLAVLTMVVLVSLPAGAEFKAAAAVRTVNPDPLLPVTGGTGGTTPAEKQVGDLTVRALVMEQDGTRVAIVGADFLGFPKALGDKARAQVNGVPPENILIGVTHSHSAPDCYGFVNRDGTCSADLKYLDSVCAKMAEAINEAVEKLEPASVKIATDKAKGKIAYNYYAPQLYDPRMSVLQCVSKDGKPIVTLVNYASHPEIIGSDQGILSPDFCGPLYDRIQAQGGGIGIYMNSAQGGMVTADCRDDNGGKDIQTWEECVRIGELMADEALRIVAAAPVKENPPMLCAATTIEFPVDSELMRMILKSSPLDFNKDDDTRVKTQLNVINLAGAQMLTIPGEALPNIGFYLKRKMHGDSNFLFGLTNDAFGYILTKEDWMSFDRYNYVSKTSLGELTGDLYIEQALKFVDSLPRP
jgi:hypothetical protein